ncbi:MAG: hypothetical protein MUD12_06080 [Spirochaetes bacterium]|nr:hypothetical protein [Spirochaetota bacterium]
MKSISWIDEAEIYALIPGYENKKPARKIKCLNRAKTNCFFSRGIKKELIDFIYRGVVKLGLKDRKLIFTRGSVKVRGREVNHAIGLLELDWDVGTSVKIPRLLNYEKKIKLLINGETRGLRLMEIIVLSCLLKMALPGKNGGWYTAMSATIIALGWGSLDGEPAEVLQQKD